VTETSNRRDLGEGPEIRETVRRHYADEAARFAARTSGCPCGGAGSAAAVEVSFGGSLYGPEATGIPEVALGTSAGCGVPTAVADLHPGEVVLDMGSGAGLDTIIAARRVAPGGRAIGLDMTSEMLELARKHAAEAGLDNVEFVEGFLEEIPLADGTVDVVLSNCVINLAADKGVVLGEAARVLRPGGRFAVTDVVADAGMDEATRTDREQWAGCLAGALTEAEYRAALRDAGFTDVEVIETHRTDDRAFAAIVRARKPS